jgi:hypothetical protein
LLLAGKDNPFFRQYRLPQAIRRRATDGSRPNENPDGTMKYVIVEVKADDQIEDAVVPAKQEFARQMAVASGMEYQMMPSSEADTHHYHILLPQ